MSVLYFRTLGRVCPELASDVNPSLRYDIPCDTLGFPFLPLYELLSRVPGFPEGVRIGFGRLPDYEGLAWAVTGINRNEQLFPKFVLGRFTELLGQESEKYRVLRAGLTFRCRIEAPEALHSRLDEWLAGITRFGLQNGEVSGEVAISVHWQEKVFPSAEIPLLLPELSYRRLHYALSLTVPLIPCLPEKENRIDQKHVSGALVLDSLKARLGEEWDAFAAEGVPLCANAFPSSKGQRGFPSPRCMVQRKLDKQTLQYMMALGPKEVGNEITEGLNRYLKDTQPVIQETFDPEQCAAAPAGTACTAIREGQVFRGFVEGTDAQIRRLVSLIGENPCFSFGFFTREGYGEAVLQVDQVETDDAPRERLMKEFDLELISNGIFFNDDGLNESSCEAFLQEMERVFPAFSRLKVVDSYLFTGIIYSVGPDGDLRDGVLRVITGGSTFRLATRDGQPMDVSEFDGAFIGDRNEEGFGELRVLPVDSRIIRYARTVPQDDFLTGFQLTSRQLQHASRFIREVMDEILRYRISLLALNDRLHGEKASDEVLEALFQSMREKYDGDLDFQVMKQWYMEAACE